MAEAKVSNLALAKAVGVSKVTVSNWRRDTQAIAPENQDAVVAFLNKHGANTTKGYLMFRESTVQPPALPARPRDASEPSSDEFIKRVVAAYQALGDAAEDVEEKHLLVSVLRNAYRVRFAPKWGDDPEMLETLAQAAVEERLGLRRVIRADVRKRRKH